MLSAESESAGKKARGRPRSAWNERIKKTLTENGMTWLQAKRMALNRKKWRVVINTPTTTAGEVTGYVSK